MRKLYGEVVLILDLGSWIWIFVRSTAVVYSQAFMGKIGLLFFCLTRLSTGRLADTISRSNVRKAADLSYDLTEYLHIVREIFKMVRYP